MSCTHPNFGLRQPDGTVKIQGSWFNTVGDMPIHKVMMMWPNAVRVGCGQCLSCRLKKSSEWAVRCTLETKQYPKDYCWFITLTYDDEHLPFQLACNFDTGEATFFNSSLVPEHLSDFMKDLRRYYEYHYDWQGIRFFGCGEYGEKFGRPHYHLIVFNMPPPPDLKPVEGRDSDYMYYRSDILSKIWDSGFVCLGECTFDTCAYVARYVLKKQLGKESERYYVERGRVPEFTRMSRKPGIAREWYEQHKDEMFDTDSVLCHVGKGSYVPKPPSYYDKLFDVDFFGFEDVKQKRLESAILAEKIRKTKSSLSEQDYLLQAESIKRSKISRLTRKL